MPLGIWRRVRERFHPARVVEFYASTEGNVVLANLSGAKVGSVGRPFLEDAQVRLVRFDHDWSIEAGLIFDIIGNDTRFFIDFKPTFGGLFTPRDRNFVIGQ